MAEKLVTTANFFTLDVFTNQLFGGNPLAVFPDTEGLTPKQMQAIAQELNLSETVFVLAPEREDCDFRLRIFTPRAELPFAGHPTVGTAYLLAHLGKIAPDAPLVNLEEGVGKVPVSLTWTEQAIQQTALSAAQSPTVGTLPPNLDYGKLLNLPPAAIATTFAPQVLSCGLPFLYIALKDTAAVDGCVLNQSYWQEHLATTEAAHVYVLAIAPGEKKIYSRMFAPGLGITEDPATGSAATSLAGYLHHYFAEADTTQTWHIQQGVKMGRPSEITLTFQQKSGQLTQIQVAGQSVLVSQGQMRIA